MINYYVKFIACDESLNIKNSDVLSYKYETKKRSDESVFDYGKRDYLVRRGGHWRTPHPRHLKQLESKLRDKTVVKSVWMTDTLIAIVFSSGAIAYLTVKLETLDVTHILFDRHFVGKLAGQVVTNVALCKSHMLFTHSDRTATLISFGKNNCTIPCRITDRDPSLHSIELGGAPRRTERHLSSCDTSNGAKILVWSVTTAEPAPWSPISAIEDLANLHLYHINGNSISLIAYHQLESETLCAELSQNQDNVIHIVEQIACQKNGVSLDWIRYEIPNANRATKLSSRESATRVAFLAPVRIVRRSSCDMQLLVACIDGSLHIVHQLAGLTRSIKAGFIATDIHWVDALVVATEESGRVQCYDRALSLLHHHTKCFDLTSYTRDGRRMQILCTQRARGGSVMLTSFTGGPLTLLRITHPRLLTAWIRARRMSSAVALLRAMDWELEGTECLWAVNRLVCAALRSGSEAVAEECSAQAALGAYLAPLAPHGPSAQRFAPPMHDLARKFFHHLLRRGRVEKALSLAVDLAAWDLFADARWAAAARRQHALAEEAAVSALHYAHIDRQGSVCSDSCSDCSSSSSSNYAETNASSEIIKTKPPPLPRVTLLPTLLPVSISQPEPLSTNSIRPNLHQYLERDNTIWNTEVRNTHAIGHDNLKPILSMQNAKWHENGLPYKAPPKSVQISEPSKTVIDIIPRTLEASHFKHVFQAELREDTPNTLYRYQNLPTVKERTYRNETGPDRHGIRTEKNKVKFSDTVTIAVVSQEPRSSVHPETARELADSLPLCPPHKYLTAFAPHTQPSPESTSQKQPKIKVIQLGMV